MIRGLFDELVKIGGLPGAIVANFLGNPVKYYAAQRRMEEGAKRHKETMRALKHQYPAGWVPLGMRPRK